MDDGLAAASSAMDRVSRRNSIVGCSISRGDVCNVPQRYAGTASRPRTYSLGRCRWSRSWPVLGRPWSSSSCPVAG